MSLLLEAYDKLPKPRRNDDPFLWQAAIAEAMEDFRREVRCRYMEGTLMRILESSPCDRSRKAAAISLGLFGTMNANPLLAQALRNDPDPRVREVCSDGMWSIWFRGSSPAQADELRQVMSQNDSAEQIAGLDDLIAREADFAEAYNQRAILWYRRGQYAKAAQDCERTLQLNPYHFGAASGLGQCYMRMNRPHAALRAFANALDIHPGLTDLRQTVENLKSTIGEE